MPSPFVGADGREYAGNISVGANVNLDGLSDRAAAMLSGILDRSGLDNLSISSGFRDPGYNAAVGGARGSQHTQGNAIDISLRGLSDDQKAAVLAAAMEYGARGIGVYGVGDVLHVDVRNQDGLTTWGQLANTYRGHDYGLYPGWARGVIDAFYDTGDLSAFMGPTLGARLGSVLDTLSMQDIGLATGLPAPDFGIRDNMPTGLLAGVEMGPELPGIALDPAWGEQSLTPDSRVAAAWGQFTPDYGATAWGVEPISDYASRIDQAWGALDASAQPGTLGVQSASYVDSLPVGLDYAAASQVPDNDVAGRAGFVAASPEMQTALPSFDPIGSLTTATSFGIQPQTAMDVMPGLGAVPVGTFDPFAGLGASVAAPRGSSQPMSVTVEQPSSFYGFPDMATFGTALSQANQNMMAMGLDANTIAPSGLGLGGLFGGLGTALGGLFGGGLGAEAGGGNGGMGGPAGGSYGDSNSQGLGYGGDFGGGWGKGD